MRGLFITFEGIDGCGKTTQARRVYQALRKMGHVVVFTREPGGTPVAEQIRSVILDPANRAMVWKTELLLYNASRAQHVAEKIVPALSRGRLVVCDRFYDATVAYQGHGRRLPSAVLAALHRISTNGLTPDLTFIFDLPVNVARARMARDGKTRDRLEQETRAFQERVRRGYLAIARQAHRRCRLIDAAHDPETVFREVMRHVLARLSAARR
jgi:dTMP kinase